MQTQETASIQQENRAARHRLGFISARAARNRKVRGLWRRGERFYAQVRVPGEKSARKIPLTAKTLTDAKEEMGKRRTDAREGALPRGGVKPAFADYVRDYLDCHGSNQSGRKAGTVTRVTRAQVNILDANIFAGQRGWLARWRIPFRQTGRELAHRYDPDDAIAPQLAATDASCANSPA